MALLFSNVRLSDKEREISFLMSGVPTKAEDLQGWTAYEKFISEKSDKTEKINVHVDSYLYGDGEVFVATPEEIAYLTMRLASKPTFLQTSCKKDEKNKSFNFVI